MIFAMGDFTGIAGGGFTRRTSGGGGVMSTLAVQRALNRLGYDPGPLDGIMGSRTRAAIRQFQGDKGLQTDGVVGPITTNSLNFAVATQADIVDSGAPAVDTRTPAAPISRLPAELPGALPQFQRPPPPAPIINYITYEAPEPIVAPKPAIDYLAQTNLLLPWLPDSLTQIYADTWALAGDVNNASSLALAAVRADDAYDELLPGNRRTDGTFRHTEAEYFTTVDAFNRSLAQINLNPEVFQPFYSRAIEGDVSAREFGDRVAKAYSDVLVNLPSIRAYYAQNYDTDLTDESIVASFLSPEIGEQVLNRRVLSSQIGGSAALRGFDLGLNEAGRLASAGLNQTKAAQFFATAARAIPTLGTFAQRFNEGTFDLAEFTEANIFGDPLAAQRIERLFSSESALFASGRGVQRGRRAGQQSGVSVR